MIAEIRNPKNNQRITILEVAGYELPLECQSGVTGKIITAQKTTDDYTNMLIFLLDLSDTFWKISSVEYGDDEGTTLIVKDAAAAFEDIYWYDTHHEHPYVVSNLVVKGSDSQGQEKDLKYFMMKYFRNSGYINDPVKRCYNTRDTKYSPGKMITTYCGSDDISSHKNYYVNPAPSAQLNTLLNSYQLDIDDLATEASSSPSLDVVSLEKCIKSIQQRGGVVSCSYKPIDYGEFHFKLLSIGDWVTYNDKSYVCVTYNGLQATFTAMDPVYNGNISGRYSSTGSSSPTVWRHTIVSTTNETVNSRIYSSTKTSLTTPRVGDYVNYSAQKPMPEGQRPVTIYGWTPILSVSHVSTTSIEYWSITFSSLWNRIIPSTGGETYTQTAYGNSIANIKFGPEHTIWTDHNIQETAIIDISPGATGYTPIYFKDGHSFIVSESYNADVISAVCLQDGNSHQYKYFLNSALEVVNDSTQQIQGRIEYKISDTNLPNWDSGKTKANEMFEDNKWEHKVEFKSDKVYHVGQAIRLFLERATLDTAIDKVWLESGDNLYHYSCGDLPTTASEKIKANGWTYAKRLPANPYVGQLVFM